MRLQSGDHYFVLPATSQTEMLLFKKYWYYTMAIFKMVEMQVVMEYYRYCQTLNA